MSLERQMEREEDAIQAEFERGDITRAQYNKFMREIARDYRIAADEQDARERDERNHW